jgi:hypothetical protein
LETPQKTGLSMEHLETHRGFQMFHGSFARHPVTGQKDPASISCAVPYPEQVPSRGNPAVSFRGRTERETFVAEDKETDTPP